MIVADAVTHKHWELQHGCDVALWMDSDAVLHVYDRPVSELVMELMGKNALMIAVERLHHDEQQIEAKRHKYKTHHAKAVQHTKHRRQRLQATESPSGQSMLASLRHGVPKRAND